MHLIGPGGEGHKKIRASGSYPQELAIYALQGWRWDRGWGWEVQAPASPGSQARAAVLTGPGKQLLEAPPRTKKGKLLLLMLLSFEYPENKHSPPSRQGEAQGGAALIHSSPGDIGRVGRNPGGFPAPSHQGCRANQMRWHLRKGLINDHSLMNHSQRIIVYKLKVLKRQQKGWLWESMNQRAQGLTT